MAFNPAALMQQKVKGMGGGMGGVGINVLGMVQRNNELVDKLTKEDEKMEEKRSKDKATGVWKRKFFDEIDANEVGGAPAGLTFECIDLDREGKRFATGASNGNVIMWERNNSMEDDYGVVEFKMALKDCSKLLKEKRDIEDRFREVIKRAMAKEEGGSYFTQKDPLFKVVLVDADPNAEVSNFDSYEDTEIQVRPYKEWKAEEDEKAKEEIEKEQRRARGISSPVKVTKKSLLIDKTNVEEAVGHTTTELGYIEPTGQAGDAKFEVLSNEGSVTIKNDGSYWTLTCDPAKVGNLVFTVKATVGPDLEDEEEFNVEVYKDYAKLTQQEALAEQALNAKAESDKSNANVAQEELRQEQLRQCGSLQKELKNMANERKAAKSKLEAAMHAGGGKSFNAHQKKVSQVLCNANENEYDSFLYSCAGNELKVWGWLNGKHIGTLFFDPDDAVKKYDIKDLAIDETAKNRLDAQIKAKEMEIVRLEKEHLKASVSAIKGLKKDITSLENERLKHDAEFLFAAAKSDLVQPHEMEAYIEDNKKGKKGKKKKSKGGKQYKSEGIIKFWKIKKDELDNNNVSHVEGAGGKLFSINELQLRYKYKREGLKQIPQDELVALMKKAQLRREEIADYELKIDAGLGDAIAETPPPTPPGSASSSNGQGKMRRSSLTGLKKAKNSTFVEREASGDVDIALDPSSLPAPQRKRTNSRDFGLGSAFGGKVKPEKYKDRLEKAQKKLDSYDIEAKALVSRINEEADNIDVTCLRVTEDMIYVGTKQGEVHELKIGKGDLEYSGKISLGKGQEVKSLEILTNKDEGRGEKLITGSSTSIQMWDLKTKQAIMTFDSQGQNITGLVLNQDTNTLISTSQQGQVAMFDVFTGQRVKTFEGFSEGSNCKCVDVDAKSTVMIVGAEVAKPDVSQQIAEIDKKIEAVDDKIAHIDVFKKKNEDFTYLSEMLRLLEKFRDDQKRRVGKRTMSISTDILGCEEIDKDVNKDLKAKLEEYEHDNSISDKALEVIIKETQEAKKATQEFVEESYTTFPDLHGKNPSDSPLTKNSGRKKKTQELRDEKKKLNKDKNLAREKRKCLGIWDMGESKVVNTIDAHADKKINMVELFSMYKFTGTKITPLHLKRTPRDNVSINSLKNVYINRYEDFQKLSAAKQFKDFETKSEKEKATILKHVTRNSSLESGKEYVVSIVEIEDKSKKVVAECQLDELVSYRDYDSSKHAEDTRFCTAVPNKQDMVYKGSGKFRIFSITRYEEKCVEVTDNVHAFSERIYDLKDDVRDSKAILKKKKDEAQKRQSEKPEPYTVYTRFEKSNYAVTAHIYKTPDGKEYGLIKIFNILTGKSITSSKTYEAYHEGALRDIRVEDKYLLTAGDDGVFKFWDLEKLVETNNGEKKSQGKFKGSDQKSAPMFMSLDSKFGDRGDSKEDDKKDDDAGDDEGGKAISSVAITDDIQYLAMSQDSGYISIFSVGEKLEEYEYDWNGLPLTVGKDELLLKFKVEGIVQPSAEKMIDPIVNIAFDTGDDEGEDCSEEKDYTLFVATISGMKCYKVNEIITNFENEVEVEEKKFVIQKPNRAKMRKEIMEKYTATQHILGENFKPANRKLQAYKTHVVTLEKEMIGKAVYHRLRRPFVHKCEDVNKVKNSMVDVTETDVVFLIIDDTIYIVGVKSGKILQKLIPPKIKQGVTLVSLEVGIDGTLVAGETNGALGENEVARTNIWECNDDCIDYSYKKALQDHTKTVTGVAIAEPYVVSVSDDGKLVLYDYEAIVNNHPKALLPLDFLADYEDSKNMGNNDFERIMGTVKKNPEKLLDIAMDIKTLGAGGDELEDQPEIPGSPRKGGEKKKDGQGGGRRLTLALPNRGNIVHHAAKTGANEFLAKIFTTLELDNKGTEMNELKVFMACVMQDGDGKSALAHAIDSKSQGFVKTIFDSYSMILDPVGEGTERHYHDLGPGKHKEIHPSDLINVQDLCLALREYPLMTADFFKKSIKLIRTYDPIVRGKCERFPIEDGTFEVLGSKNRVPMKFWQRNMYPEFTSEEDKAEMSKIENRDKYMEMTQKDLRSDTWYGKILSCFNSGREEINKFKTKGEIIDDDGGEELQEGVPVVAKLVPIKNIAGWNDDDSTDLMKAVIQACDTLGKFDLCENEVIATVIQFKWESCVKWQFLFHTFMALCFTGCFTADAFLYTNTTSKALQDGMSSDEVTNLLPAMGAIFFWFMFVYHEALQIASMKDTLVSRREKERVRFLGPIFVFFKRVFNHFTGDIWNGLDFLTLTLVALTYAFRIYEYATSADGFGTSTIAMATALPLSYLNLLYFMQGFEVSGELVRMVIGIIRGIAAFTAILATIVVGFAFAFYILYQAGAGEYASAGAGGADVLDEPYGMSSPRMSLFAGYLLMLGDFNAEEFSASLSYNTTLMLFVVFMFLVNIVLLNLLIAIMGDIFARIQESARAAFLYAKASIIVEFESVGKAGLFSRCRNHSKNYKTKDIDYPEWLQVLEPQRAADNKDISLVARMKLLTDMLESNKAVQTRQILSLESKLEEHTQKTKAEFKSQTRRVEDKVLELTHLMQKMAIEVDGIKTVVLQGNEKLARQTERMMREAEQKRKEEEEERKIKQQEESSDEE